MLSQQEVKWDRLLKDKIFFKKLTRIFKIKFSDQINRNKII